MFCFQDGGSPRTLEVLEVLSYLFYEEKKTPWNEIISHAYIRNFALRSPGYVRFSFRDGK